MNKFLAIILAFIAVLSLCSCGSGTTETVEDTGSLIVSSEETVSEETTSTTKSAISNTTTHRAETTTTRPRTHCIF